MGAKKLAYLGLDEIDAQSGIAEATDLIPILKSGDSDVTTLTLTQLATFMATGLTSLSLTTLTMDAGSIVTDTTTGLEIATGAAQKLGFFGATPVIRQAHVVDPVAGSQDLIDGTGGTPDGSGNIANLADGSTYANDHATIENNFATISAEYNKLKDDVEANNAVIDSLLARLETFGFSATS